MPKWLKVLILIILILAAVTALAGVLGLGKIKAAREGLRGKEIYWGAVIRPFAIENADPKITTKQEFDLLGKLGAKAVRANIESNPELNDLIVDEAQKRNMQVVLILEEQGVDYDASGDFYQRGYDFAKPYAERYKGKVKYYQLSNEITGTTFRKPEDSGPSLKNRDGLLYDATRYENVRDYIKGQSDAIGEIDARAQRIVSGNYILVDIFKMIVDEGVNFEIIGWDWYSDLGDDIAHRTIEGEDFSYPEFAKSLGKKLWLVEVNREGGSFGGKEKEQADFIAHMAQNAWDNQVPALFVHMLTDFQPLWDESIGHLGLVTLDENKNGPWEIGGLKPAFGSYQDFIAGHRYPKGFQLNFWENLSLRIFPN